MRLIAYENDMATRKNEIGMTAAQRVYVAVRKAIISNDYPVGHRLREETLAEQNDTSRTPAREALQRLASEGFVEFRPRSGAVVKGWTRADVREIFEVRATLEGMAARLAATNATPADVDRLGAMCGEMEEAARSGSLATDASLLSEVNKAFHLRILEIAGNARLASIAANLMEVGMMARSYETFSVQDRARSASDHRDLVQAISIGDGQWAEAVMRSHILAAASVFQGTETKSPGRRRKRSRGQEADSPAPADVPE